jgi:hypothetical protein
MKKLVSHLLEPRSFLLGTTVFFFVWASSMRIRGPLWEYHREMFIATVLLISAIGLVINRVWSNLLAAVVSGQLPFAFFGEFWMLSLNAEVPLFSSQHIKTWVRLISSVGVTPFLLLTLSTVILSFSVVSILHRLTEMPAGDA